jgi:hypothetical protein
MRFKSAVTAFLFCFFAAVAVPAQSCQPERRQITVSGTSEIYVEPDQAQLNFGVTTEAKTLPETTATQDRRTKSVLAILSESGIEDRDIQTSRLRVEPEHNDKDKLIGYSASQSLAVTLRDLSKFDDLWRKLLAGGVTVVYSVDFRIADSRPYADKARTGAVRAAHEKAAAMAGELGVKVGKPLSIVEEDIEGLRSYATANVSYVASGVVAGDSSTIASGQVRVRAKVTIRFELE